MTPEAALAALLDEAMRGGYVAELPAEVIAARLIAFGVRVTPDAGRAAVIAEIRAGVRALSVVNPDAANGYSVVVRLRAVLALLDRLEGTREAGPPTNFGQQIADSSALGERIVREGLAKRRRLEGKP